MRINTPADMSPQFGNPRQNAPCLIFNCCATKLDLEKRLVVPKIRMERWRIVSAFLCNCWRNIAAAWWAPHGFAGIPTTAIDPPHRAASLAVPALSGPGPHRPPSAMRIPHQAAVVLTSTSF